MFFRGSIKQNSHTIVCQTVSSDLLSSRSSSLHSLLPLLLPLLPPSIAYQIVSSDLIDSHTNSCHFVNSDMTNSRRSSSLRSLPSSPLPPTTATAPPPLFPRLLLSTLAPSPLFPRYWPGETINRQRFSSIRSFLSPPHCCPDHCCPPLIPWSIVPSP